MEFPTPIPIIIMQPDTFQIAHDKDRLDYYSYLREALEATETPYWIGNPSVSITNGTIHLHPLPPDPLNFQNEQQYLAHYKKRMIEAVATADEPFSRVLLLTGIPSNKSPVEVLERLERYASWVEQARVVKTSHFKYYAMLLLLHSGEKALTVYKQALGEEYNALDMERILLREVLEITIHHTEEKDSGLYHFKRAGQEGGERVSPLNIFLKSQPPHRKHSTSVTPSKKDRFLHSNLNTHSHQKLNPHRKLSAKGEQTTDSKPEESSICTICLESNHETVISILCEHYFHAKCLSQWREDTCPLCRYHQQPPIVKFCEKCNQCEGLWACLICGARMCCGVNRDILGEDSHIYEHYLETQHRLSMDLETKFIFDASQSAFLHKMLYQQLKREGGMEKLEVENEGEKKKSKQNKVSEKISEFERNISEEMQIQRVYFEETINKQVKSKKDIIKEKKKLMQEMEEEVDKIEEEAAEAEAKSIKLDEAIQSLDKELKIILDVQKFWKAKAGDKNKLIKQEESREEKELLELNRLIGEKKEELKDYRTNLSLQGRLKSNLGGDKIQAEVYLGSEPKKKKK